MSSSGDILISLLEQHATSVFAGSKTVEIRRRCPRVHSGTRVWIYAKLPKGAVVGFATVADVVTDTPQAIWKSYKPVLGIERLEFDTYLRDCSKAHAIVLTGVTPLSREITLAQLRDWDKTFHPPQFFLRLNGLAEKMDSHHQRKKRAS